MFYFFISLAYASDYYNILALDGGGIKGVITVTCIEQMELWAYEFAKNESLDIREYTGKGEGRIPMKDMFDMLSGTSTGSIMSAGFSLADD